MSIKSSQNDPFIIWFHQQWIKSYLLRKLSQSSFFPSPPSLSCSFPSVYAIISKITLKLLNPFWVMFQSDRDCKGRKRHIGWQFSSNYKNTFLEFVLDQLLLFPEALNCGIHNWFCGWIQVGSLYLEVHFFLRGWGEARGSVPLWLFGVWSDWDRKQKLLWVSREGFFFF